MKPDSDEETKTLLTSDDSTLSAPLDVNQPKRSWATRISLRTIYAFCFFVLVLNVGLLGVSWRAQQEIKSLYSTMGRDVTRLLKPDPFAGLSEAAKSKNGGEEIPFHRFRNDMLSFFPGQFSQITENMVLRQGDNAGTPSVKCGRLEDGNLFRRHAHFLIEEMIHTRSKQPLFLLNNQIKLCRNPFRVFIYTY